MAAGITMRLFTSNFSRILQPMVWVEAIVVSEMNERLSPKKAPPTTMATMKGRDTSVFSARPMATGASATMVPTEVPTEMEMKQAARKMPANSSWSGRRWRVRFTVASTAPMAWADCAKAPARMNIHIISMMFLSDAPREKRVTRSPRGMPRVMSRA